MCRVRQLLGEALSAEDDAAVLQELASLEGAEAEAERAELPAVPAAPEVGSGGPSLALHASSLRSA